MSLFGADGANQAIGMVGASAISAVSASHGAYKQYKYQKKLQEQAYEQSRDFRRKAYQDTRYSLQKAGYNPMLAISNGEVGSGFQSAGSAQSEDYSGVINSALDYARYRQDKKLNEATVKKTEADTHLADTQTYRNQMENYYFPTMQEATINQINSATDLNTMMTTGQMLKNEWYPKEMKAYIESLNKNSSAAVMNALSNQKNAETNRYNADVNRYKKRYDIHAFSVGGSYDGYSKF